MPLFWLSLAFLGGILLGELLDWPRMTWLGLLGVACAWVLLNQVLKRRFSDFYSRLPNLPDISIPYPLLLVPLCLGAIRFQSTLPTITPDFIAWYNDDGEEYIVQGVLVFPPDERDLYTNLKVRVDELHAVGDATFTEVEGLLLARIPYSGDWRYGDRIRLEGELVTPPEQEGFSYRAYLAHKGVYSYMPHAQARTLLRDQLLPQVTDRLRGEGINTFYYGNFNAEHSQWRTYGDAPRYSTEYCGLRGRPAILAEAYSYATYRQRIVATRAFVTQCLDWVHQNAPAYRQAVDEAVATVVRNGTRPDPQASVPLRSEIVAAEQPVVVAGYRRPAGREGTME